MILVTGGAGFVGRHLVGLLLERGESVRVLDRTSSAIASFPSSIEYVHGDIRDRSCVAQAVRGCRAVYHLAADPQLWARRRGHFHAVNYLGTVNVLDAAIAASVPRILHTSTESILTRAKQTAPIAEDQAITVHDVIGPYCRSKFLAEKYAFQLASRSAPIVVVNPTLPIGPGDWGRSPPTRMMLDFCLGKRSAYLDAELNLIDVRDVAEGMVRALEHGEPGRRYLLGAENWSIRSVFGELARLTGLPEPRWRVPYPIALAAAYVSEFLAHVVTHEIPAASVTGVKLTRRRMHFDASRSLTALRLTPRPVATSIAEAVAWFRERGWIE